MFGGEKQPDSSSRPFTVQEIRVKLLLKFALNVAQCQMISSVIDLNERQKSCNVRKCHYIPMSSTETRFH